MITQERIEEIVKQYADEYYLMTDETIAKAAAAIMAEIEANTHITEAGLLSLGFEVEEDDVLCKWAGEYYLDYSERHIEIGTCKYLCSTEVPGIKTIEDVKTLIRFLEGGDK